MYCLCLCVRLKSANLQDRYPSSEAVIATTMSSSSPSDSKENVGLAFALVFAAGLATALGACVVFVPRWVAYAQRSTLAAGLGLSAGVMVYVSFVEIFQKSRKAFEQAGYEESTAYGYATLCFFGGVALMEVSGIFVSRILILAHRVTSLFSTYPCHSY
jgi:zinc transporter ZupT